MSDDRVIDLLEEMVALLRRAEARDAAKARRQATAATTRSRRQRAQLPAAHFGPEADSHATRFLRRVGVAK